MKNKYIIENKKIKYKYKIEKKIIAGIILKGYETKYIKKKKINISNTYFKIDKKNEIYMIGLIFNFNKKNKHIENKNRKIKILLKKKEIKLLNKKIKLKGYTLICISIIKKKK